VPFTVRGGRADDAVSVGVEGLGLDGFDIKGAAPVAMGVWMKVKWAGCMVVKGKIRRPSYLKNETGSA